MAVRRGATAAQRRRMRRGAQGDDACTPVRSARRAQTSAENGQGMRIPSGRRRSSRRRANSLSAGANVTGAGEIAIVSSHRIDARAIWRRWIPRPRLAAYLGVRYCRPCEMGIEPSVGVKALRAVFGTAQAAGLDGTALAAEHGVSAEDLQNPDFRFPHTAWGAVWDDIVRRSGDPGIGLRAAPLLSAGHWDVIDYVTASSDTLGDAFRRLSRYFPVISTGVTHVLRVEGAMARFVRSYVPGAARNRAATEYSTANIALRFRSYTAAPWRPAWVSFVGEPSSPIERYAELFGCDVRFDEGEDAIDCSSGRGCFFCVGRAGRRFPAAWTACRRWRGASGCGGIGLV